MKFEVKLKKIDHRNWLKIRSNWFQNLPHIIPAGSAPEFELSQTMGLEHIADEIQDTGDFKFELPGLKAAIFHEGIFLLNKTINVSGSSEVNISNGILTWSLSNGYHSAFFALKAILSFLGITIVDINNKMILVDAWPEPEKLSKSKIKKGILPKTEMKSIKMPRLQHYHIWQIFQRVLRTLSISILKKEYINFILSLNYKDFAFQRNNIHYKNNEWTLNDLHEPLVDKSFGVRSSFLEDIESVTKNTSDFSILLSYILINFAYIILKDLAIDAPVIFEEFSIIKNKLSLDYHKRFKITVMNDRN